MPAVDPSFLRQVIPFKHLSEANLALLASYMEVRTFLPGEMVFAQGNPRRALFVIIEGEMDIVDGSLGSEKSYVVCGPCTVVGEPVLIEEEGATHALSARAVAECKAGRLSRAAIDEIRRDHLTLFSDMLVGVSRLMARRMTNASRSDRGQGAVARLGTVTRVEHDLLGDREVPDNVLWGVQTLRAIENFSISGVRLDHFPEMIEAMAMVKRACARTNCALGLLDERRCAAIERACDELLRGLWHGHFVVDMVQGGAGTSTNMNANEVIANRALELLGERRGQYDVLHPNTHVNMSQSTNDVYPSSIKIAVLLMIERLIDEARLLAESFASKSDAFKGVVKMGRTQLQDAVPMTLGQEFGAWSLSITEAANRLARTLPALRELNVGGTAIGTGINTDPRYSAMVIEELRQHSGLDLRLAPDLVEATQDTGGFVELSGVFKMLAVRLSKICNDLRLLSSGPRCGLDEINLPPMQPGSTIMPGKVNPVIPEVVNQVAFQVIGLDVTVAMASEAGQLQLNVFEPVIAFNLFTLVKMLSNAMETLRLRCVDGITANERVCRDMVYNSIGVVTALNPYLGYEKTSIVAKDALQSGRSVYDIVLERGFMDKAQLDEVLKPEAMTQPTLKS